MRPLSINLSHVSNQVLSTERFSALWLIKLKSTLLKQIHQTTAQKIYRAFGFKRSNRSAQNFETISLTTEAIREIYGFRFPLRIFSGSSQDFS